MLTRKLGYAMLAAVMLGSAAFAHDVLPKGKNGGQQVEAGDYHVEAVAKGTTLEVFVRDHDDKVVSTKGFKGTAVLIIKGKPQQIALTAKDENALTGTSSVDLGTPIRGAIQITNAKNQTVQAKF